MDFSDVITYLPLLVTCASAVATALPKPKDPNTPAGIGYNLLNLVALNLGHATNASHVVQGTAATINAEVQTFAPHAAPYVLAAEQIAQIGAVFYAQGHAVGSTEPTTVASTVATVVTPAQG